MSIPNESILIQRLHNPATRRQAFEEVVTTYGQTLYWQIRRMVTYHDDADDILQNTFIKAWSNLDSFRGDSKLQTWLYKIAYRETLTFISRQPNHISLDTTIFSTDDNDDPLTLAGTFQSDPYFDGDETEALLQSAVAALPAKQRAVFNMKYFQELKYEEIADITGTSIGALKASYHLAVKKIEDFFHRHD